MDNILQEIILCEEEALRIENEAKQQSIDILAEARKKAQELMEKSLIEGEALVDELLEKARNEALQERKQYESMHLDGHEEIRAKSRQKLEAAAELIAERIVSKPWQ